MADADRGSPGKRSPTIDLKATEVPTPPAESAAAPEAPETPEAPAGSAGAAAAPPSADAPPAPDTGATAWRFEPSTDAADGAPPGEPPAPPPPRPEPSRLPGMLAAGAVGAAVSLAVLLALWGAGLLDHADDGAARIASLESRLREIAARPAPAGNTQAIDDLAARLAKLESAPSTPAPPADDPAAAARLSGVEASAKAAADKVAALEARLQELTAATGEARRRADAAAAQASRSATATDAAAERREIEALAGRVAAVEGALKQVRDEAARRAAEGAVDRGVRRALATIALRNAVERGGPFAAELAAAKPFVSDPAALAPLEPFAAAGLPGARAVGAELTRVASAMVRAAETGPRDGGFLDKLQANAERLVRVRPVGDTPGDDPPAIVARAEARAKEGDLAAALAELRKLPEPVRAPAAAWIEKAQAHLAAVEASRTLSADAVGALGRS